MHVATAYTYCGTACICIGRHMMYMMYILNLSIYIYLHLVPKSVHASTTCNLRLRLSYCFETFGSIASTSKEQPGRRYAQQKNQHGQHAMTICKQRKPTRRIGNRWPPTLKHGIALHRLQWSRPVPRHTKFF